MPKNESPLGLKENPLFGGIYKISQGMEAMKTKYGKKSDSGQGRSTRAKPEKVQNPNISKAGQSASAKKLGYTMGKGGAFSKTVVASKGKKKNGKGKGVKLAAGKQKKAKAKA